MRKLVQLIGSTCLALITGVGAQVSPAQTAAGAQPRKPDDSDARSAELPKQFEKLKQQYGETTRALEQRISALEAQIEKAEESSKKASQANHLGVTIETDIIKHKLPENNGGYLALNTNGASYGKFDKRIYSDLISDHPIDLCDYQLANCYMGRAGLINSGGPSGANDFEEAVVTAVINKRAGGSGLIAGRKVFERPFQERIQLLNVIQDVYLSPQVTVAGSLRSQNQSSDWVLFHKKRTMRRSFAKSTDR